MHKNANHINEHADGYTTYITHRKRRVAVTNEALSNSDVLACILRGNVGPSTFAAVSERFAAAGGRCAAQTSRSCAQSRCTKAD